MAKKRRPARIPTPTWETRPRSKGRLQVENGWQGIAFLGILGVAIVAVVLIGVAIFSRFWEENSRPSQLAIQVGDYRYDLGYYVDRMDIYVQRIGGPQSASANPQTVLPFISDTIIEERIALQFAAEQGLSVTPEEVEAEIRRQIGIPSLTPSPTAAPDVTTAPTSELTAEQRAAIDALASATASRGTFDAAYKQELALTGLSDQEFRDMVTAQLLIKKLGDKFAAEVPAEAESVHYEQILVRDNAAADEIVNLLNNGGDFAALARQRSLDTKSRERGGDVDWVARGVLDPATESVLFGTPVGGIQRTSGAQGVFIFKVLEHSPAYPVEQSQAQAIASRLYQSWLETKRQAVEVQDDLDLSQGNAGKIEWVLKKIYG